MAERRMFAKSIIDSDMFLEMPMSTQALYFHLGMRADDEGFINNPRRIQKLVGASEDDFKLLIAKNYIIPFDSGIIVIRHWKIHNYIQTDRFHPTLYQEEKGALINDGKVYEIAEDVMPLPVAEENPRISSEPEGFEEFWGAYPRKVDKGNARKKYVARIKDGWKPEELILAAQRYAQQMKRERTEDKYIKHGATFLSDSTPFTDFLDKKNVKKEIGENDNPYEDWS